jgi:TonB family protein
VAFFHMHTQNDDTKDVVIRIPVIRIPWDSNTFRGFVLALVIIVFFVFVSPFIKVSAPPILRTDTTAIPLTVLTQLRFGDGDSPQKSGGNLQQEGAAAKAPVTAPRFADAKAPPPSPQTSNAKPASSTDLQVNVQPVRRDPETSQHSGTGTAATSGTTLKTAANDNTASSATGDRTPAENGTGRGLSGTGSGAGLGYNIEWGGGGGNVIVLNKSIPKPPQGLNNSTIVKLKFVVDKNGDVESVIPLTRGAPQAERAALKAMWLWKFRVKNEQRAEGIIKFTFDVN